MGERVTFENARGGRDSGYLASTGESDAPAIVVIQEWWGVQNQIEGVCDRYAKEGFHALAPDLYAGTTVPYHDTVSANAEMESLDFASATDVTVAAAAKYLKPPSRKLGLTGYCLGGIVSILGAIRLDAFSASVCYYGLPAPQLGRPMDVRVPLQGHFANLDTWCTPEMVDRFEAGLREAGRTYEFYRYDADHGFANEDLGEHNAKAAALAWKRGLEFWDKHLRN